MRAKVTPTSLVSFSQKFIGKKERCVENENALCESCKFWIPLTTASVGLRAIGGIMVGQLGVRGGERRTPKALALVPHLVIITLRYIAV